MKVLRGIGILLLGLILIVGAFIGYAYVKINSQLNATFDISDVADIPLPTEEAALAEGQRLYVTLGCIGCHGANGGGGVVVDDPMFGYFPASNLTSGSGGVANEYMGSDDWVRAIRHGVSPDGKPLVIMPSTEYGHLTDADMSRIVAYLESLPPVNSDLKPMSIALPAKVMFAMDEAGITAASTIDHKAVGPWDVEVGATAAYGEYLAARCAACHGENLDGNWQPPPGEPQPTNITPHETGIGGWTLEQFTMAVQTGVRPDGSKLDPFMPWPYYAQLTDLEVEAIYLYLQTVAPVATEE
ncbi:MAG: cytochrome c [Candidatus Promineifilaceae bacterium]|nr:cytochrome c [Candidatus Promineifilaceae bacterium]